jgi:hypothetical protein
MTSGPAETDNTPPAPDESTHALPSIAPPPVPRGARPVPAVLAVLFIAAGAAGALWLTDTIRSAGPAQALPDVSPSIVPEPSPATSDTIYQAPQDLCAAADFTSLRPTFDMLDELESHDDDSAGYVSIAECRGSTGNETVQGSFDFKVRAYANAASAKEEFTASRAVVEKTSATAGQADLGEVAYSYTEPGRGPAVELYDGNVRMSLSWSPKDAKSRVPDGTAQALVDMCRINLKLIRPV